MIPLSYLLLSLLLMLIILFGYRSILSLHKSTTTKRNKKLLFVALGFTAWLAYNFIIAKTGILQNFTLPPRFPMLLILPAFAFIAILFYRHYKNPVIQSIPPYWLVFYQSFRVILEFLFVQSVLEGMLHPEMTIKGYNFDIVFAATAPIVGFLFYKKMISEKVVIIWNFIGLAVIASIIFVVTTTTYFPQMWGQVESLMNKETMTFPYVLIASFLMPSAVFMHILSIIQLSRRAKTFN